MNFDNIRINDAYSRMYAPKTEVNESVTNEGLGQLRRVRAIKFYDRGWGWLWKLVDDSTGETIQKYDFLDSLKKDVKEFGYLVMNDIDKEDAEAMRNDTTIGEDAKDARNGGPGADLFDREYSYDVALKAKYLFDELAYGLKESKACKDPQSAYSILKNAVQVVLNLGYNHYFGKTIMQQKGKIVNVEKSNPLNAIAGANFRGNHEDTTECAQTNEDAKWDGDERDAKGIKTGVHYSDTDGRKNPDAVFLPGHGIPERSFNLKQRLRQNKTDNQKALGDFIRKGNDIPMNTLKQSDAELQKKLIDDKHPIGEADDGSETENSGNKDIFTLDITSVSNEGRSIDDMKWSSTYYDFDEACDAAMECAKSYADDPDVLNVSVIAGEYEKPNGDVYGEPDAVYTVSNKDEETTAIAREKAGFVAKYVDAYATDGKLVSPELAAIRNKEDIEHHTAASDAVHDFHADND